MQKLCIRLMLKTLDGKDLFDGHDAVQFAARLAIRAVLIADALCIVMHLTLFSLGLLPYSLIQSLSIGTAMATVIGGVVPFYFGYHVGVALQKVSVDRDAFRHLSSSDSLTGLMNRRAFMPMLKAAQPGETFAILDIDHFKQINDTFGHGAGDKVIVAVADALKAAFGDCATGVARLGGEEFGVLLNLPFAHSERRINMALKRIADLRLKSAGRAITVTLSAGMASFHGRALADEVYRAADDALYAAKAAGRNCLKTERDMTGPETPALRATG